MKQIYFIICLLFGGAIGLHGQDTLASYSLLELRDKAIQSYVREQITQIDQYTTYGLDKFPIQQLASDTLIADLKWMKARIHILHMKYDLAIPLVEQAQKIYKEYQKVGNKNEQILLQIFSELYYYKGDYENAASYIKQLMYINEHQSEGIDSASYADLLNNMGEIHLRLGQLKEAGKYYSRAIGIFKDIYGASSERYAFVLSNYANFVWEQGNTFKAIALLTEAMEIQRKVLGEDDVNYAYTQNDLAVFYCYMGDYQMAKPLLENVKNIFKEYYGKEHPDYASCLNNLAMIYSEEGKKKKALLLMQKANEIDRLIYGENHDYFATSLNNIAIFHLNEKEYSKGLAILNQVVAIYENIKDKVFIDYADILLNRSRAQLSLKNYTKAKEDILRVSGIYEKHLNKDHYKILALLNLQTEILLESGAIQEGKEALSRAFEIYASKPISLDFSKDWKRQMIEVELHSNAHNRKFLNTLDLCFLIDDLSKKQQQHITAYIEVLIQKMQKTTFEEKDKLALLKKKSFYLNKYLSLLDENRFISEGFEMAEQNKSVLLYASTQTQSTKRMGSIPKEVLEEEKSLKAKKKALQAALLQAITQEEKRRIRRDLIDVNRAIQSFKESLKERFPKYTSLMGEEYDLALEEVQRQLPENAAIIEYVISDTILHIFRIDKEKTLWKKVSLEPIQFNQNFDAFRNLLTDYQQLSKERKEDFEEYVRLAHFFYEQLLAPVLIDDDKDIQHLIIIPEGKVALLPFETFIQSLPTVEVAGYGDLSYLLLDYSISYNYSTGIWYENMQRENGRNNNEIFAVAGTYGKEENMGSIAKRNGLVALPFAQQEVANLEHKYAGCFAYEEEASELNVKENAKKYGVLHFAVHGLMHNKQPILSSLAFTDTKSEEEDNFLQAYEISQLELNADLVVLSACETGTGKVEKGNGVASIARAFMYANIPSLLVTLWKVNDQSTAILMEYFYENLAEGMSKDDALRQAKISYLKKAEGIGKHPALWSAFIQMGNTDGIVLKKRKNWTIYLALGLVFCLFVGVWSYRKESV